MFANFRTYQRAKELYFLISQLKMPSFLRNQALRASSSVVLNLAEGRGRESVKEQRRFFVIAQGSLKETQSILELIPNGGGDVQSKADEVGAMLFCLIRSLEAS